MRIDNRGFWFIQIPGWALLLYLVVAQGISAISYETGVAMGAQESAEMISEVGAAFWYGFAFGDSVFYIPVLLLGLAGHIVNTRWSRILLAASFGVSVYWPVVCLAALVSARSASGWNLGNELSYWIVLPVVATWGAMGLIYLVISQQDAGSGGAR
jgi:hypothetical protein